MKKKVFTENDHNSRPDTAAALNDPAFLSELRAMMLKFALLQLSDKQLAEDAVQEALMGALKNAASFSRRAALKTWVFAILKNKITDTLRQRNKMPVTSSIGVEGEDQEISALLFNKKGHWQDDERPATWSQPMESVKNDHFWRIFETCLDALPENQARVFMMREFLDFDSNAICETLDISTSNLHVMLYRTRLRLRECLENKWFLEGK